MSAPAVHAILVTDGLSEHLPASLAAIAAQTTRPDALHLVMLGGADAPSLPDGLRAQILSSTAGTWGAAIDKVVEDLDLSDHDALWLLHDDTAPEPSTLQRLVGVLGKRSRAAVVGAAQVRWRDRSRLVNLGVTVSRLGARRVGLVVEDDVNQGQHDWREDVMAVSLAASLVRVSAWRKLGGIDEGYRGFGDSLEFCRRAWAAGFDVVVEPHATVRHAQDNLYGLRSSRSGRASTHAARRVSEWHHALAWAPWWLIPVLAIMVPLSVAARIVVRIAQNTPRIALAEAAVPFLLAARLPDIVRTARSGRTRGATGPVPPALFASPRQSIDAIRHRELGAFETERARRVPSDLVVADLRRAAASHRTSAWVVLAASLAAAAVLSASWLTSVVAGQQLSAPVAGVSNLGTAELWSRATTGWSDAGLGSPGIDGAFAALMLPLSIVPGGFRVGFAAALLLAPVVAALGAWWAAGAATRAPWVRSASAMVWALWPPFLAALLDGALGAVLVHALLPLAALAIAKAGGWQRGERLGAGQEHDAPGPSPSAGLAAALVLTAITIAQPVLLIPLVLFVAVLAALAPGRRLRLAGAAAVPAVVGLPGLLAAWRAREDAGAMWSVLAREPGAAVVPSQAPWRDAWGLADPSRWHEVFSSAEPLGVVAAGVVFAAALAALANARAWRAAVAGLSLVAVGWAVSAVSADAVAAWPDGAGAASVAGWAGVGSSVACVGALTAALSAHGAILVRPERRFAVGRVSAAALAVLALGASVFVTTALAWPGAPRGALAVADAHVLPLALPLDLESSGRVRVLVLGGDSDGNVTYAVLSRDGSTALVGNAARGPDGTPLGSDAGDATVSALAASVARLAASPQADGATLRAWGIGAVVVEPDQDRLRAALDVNPSLGLVGGSERGTTYRWTDVDVTRAWVEAGDTTVAADMTSPTSGRVTVPSGQGVLIIAVPFAAGWSATVDGVELDPVADPLGRMAFELSGQGGTVDFSYRDPVLRWWLPLASVMIAWAAVGAVPLRRREGSAP